MAQFDSILNSYQIYGLTLASELKFPELVSAPEQVAPDVTLRVRDVPGHLEKPRRRGVCYEATAGEVLLWLNGVARFLVRNGRELTVAAETGVPEATIRHFALASPLAGLLFQRGLLPLHASAISTPSGAVAFLSGAGFGKSTLAAEFWRRGYHVMSDDITAVRIDSTGVGWVESSYPHLRLWPDSLAAIGVDSAGLTKVRPESERRLLPCGDRFESGAVRLAAIYVVERGEVAPGGRPLTRLDGAQRVAAVMDLVYQLGLALGLGRQREVFEQVTAVVKTMPVILVLTPANEFALRRLADGIEGDFRS